MRTFIQSDDIKDDAIIATKMAVNSVTTNALTDSAVTNSKLGSLSVSQLKIANEAVGITQIEHNAITNAKMADNAISSSNIIDGAVIGIKLDTTAKQAVLQYKKITSYVQANGLALSQGMTNTEVTSIIGLTTTPATSAGVGEGIIADSPKNQAYIRDAYTGEPALTNSLEIYARITYEYPGITQWFLTFYTQAPNLPEVVTPIPQGLTVIDWQYLQRYNMNTVDESFAASDKFFNGTVDLTEVLNINQLAKDIYTSPVLTNLGNAHLTVPLETQIQEIVQGLTTITPVLAPRSVPGIAIQINAITQLHISSGAVGTSQIENQAITNALLADNSVTNTKIAALSISTGQLQDVSVSTGKLQDTSVTQGKIANAAVGLTQIESQAILTGLLRDQAVTQPKIASQAVGVTQIELEAIVTNLIRDFAVTNAKLAPNSVTSDKIADGTVIAVDLAPSAVDTLELSNSAVTNPKLAANAVATANITDSAVTNPKLAVNAVTSTNISDSSIIQSKISDGAVGLTQIELQAIITNLIRDFAVTNVKLAPNSVTSDKIADGTVIAVDLAPSAVDTLELSNSAVTNPKLAVNAVTSDKIAAGQVVKTIAAYGQLTLTDNVQLAGSPSISVTSDGISNAIRIEVMSLNLSQLSDVIIASPAVNDVIQYNGIEWVNGTPVNTSAGAGVIYFLNDLPSSDGNFTLSFAPDTALEHSDSVVVNNSTDIISGYLSAPLGRTQLDGGIWEFDLYRYVDVVSGTSTIVSQVLRRFLGAGTVTITGSGTSRLATITGGTPFLAGDANADMTLSGYIETPTQTFQVTGFTSSSIVTIATPSGYVNESSVAYAVHRNLFQVESGEINDTTVTLENVLTAQPAYTGFGATDELSVRFYGRTTNVGNITINLVHDGTTHYSHIHTPLVTRHNDLAGLQGGTGNEYYHLTATQASYLSTLTGNVQTQLDAKASTALNNLTNVAFNQDLTPDTGNTRSVGSPSLPIQDINLKGSLQLQQTGAGTNAISVHAPAAVTSYPIALPGAQGLSNTFPQNDGNGNLAWNLVNGAGIANGAVGLTQIELQSIISSLIRDLAVTNAKLAPNSVTSDKIADGTVIAADIAPGAIDTLELSNLAVTNSKLAVNAVATVNITDSAVTNSKLAVNAVTSTNISDSAITQSKISAGAVGLTEIELQSITTALIRDLAVTQPKIAAGAVGLTQLASEVFAAQHQHFTNVLPVNSPDGLTNIFVFNLPGTPTSGHEMVFVNGVLRFVTDDYAVTYLTNQLNVAFTFVPANTSKIIASGIYSL
jgi:hypothetical protein